MVKWNFKRNILLIILAAMVLNAGVAFYLNVRSPSFAAENYQMIQCADAKGVIHKCIRVDSAAGEINNNKTGASYRVIYGY